MFNDKDSATDYSHDFEKEILEYEIETEEWIRELHERVEREKNMLISIILVVFGITLLRVSIFFVINGPHAVLQAVLDAPWVFFENATYLLTGTDIHKSIELLRNLEDFRSLVHAASMHTP